MGTCEPGNCMTTPCRKSNNIKPKMEQTFLRSYSQPVAVVEIAGWELQQLRSRHIQEVAEFDYYFAFLLFPCYSHGKMLLGFFQFFHLLQTADISCLIHL